MKKPWIILLVLALFTPTFAQAANTPPAVKAKAMILYHAPSGRVLAEKNADDTMLIASTTKLMTALVAAEGGNLDREVEILPSWTAVEGSSMYLKAGETYTLRELLQGLLLVSGNDAALAIAETVAGSVQGFTEQMNRKAGELGLSCTHFSNPHGLDAEDHYSTARDLAVLMGQVMELPALREILGMRSAQIHDLYYENHNKLLDRCKGVNGGKTGYTKAAGRCLVSSCRRDELELICVTLSDPDDWADHEALYDWGFSRYRAISTEDLGSLPSVPLVGGEGKARVDWGESPDLCVDRDSQIRRGIYLPRFVFAPVTPGGRAGEMRLWENGTELVSLPLVWSGTGKDETIYIGAVLV